MPAVWIAVFATAWIVLDFAADTEARCGGREPVPCELVNIDADCRYSIETFAKYADASPVKKRRQSIAKVLLPAVRKPSAKRRDSLNELILECDIAEDRSRADFALCCFAIKHGIASDLVWAEVQNIGKFAERGEAYFTQTWDKAEGQVRTETYEKAEKKTKTSEKLATDKTRDDNTDQGLPIIALPGGQSRVVDSAGALGRLLGKTGRIYTRGTVCRLEHENDTPVLTVLTPAHLPSLFETVAKLVKQMVFRDGNSAEVAAVCSESTAKLILLSEAFRDAIPPIQVITKCPVLLERETLLEITGYDRVSGVYAGGKAAEKVSLDEARQLFDVLLRDFRFKSPSDKSRAAAAMITPALVFGGLLGGRPAVDLVEADASQAGKGFFNKCKAAIYNHVPQTVKQSKHASLGGIEEEFNLRLIRGACFVSLDNIRGKLDSPALESFLTEDTYIARIPYEQAEVDPRRVVVMMTSNKAEFTDDFGNRSSCTSILKQPPGYQFTQFREGNLLAHIRTNQPKFLGAVHAVVREWHRLGKPRTNETRHDFREWAGALDWIVQNILGLPPLIDGHQETKERMTNPHMNWLRDVALVVRQEKQLDQWLRPFSVLEVLDGTDVPIPGVSDHDDIEREDVRTRALQQLGKRLKTCFKSRDDVELAGFRIRRREIAEPAHARTVKEYHFALDGNSPDTFASPLIVAPAASDGVTTANAHSTLENDVPLNQAGLPPDASEFPPDRPLIDSPDFCRDSPNPPDVSSKHVRTEKNTSPTEINYVHDISSMGSSGGSGGNGVSPPLNSEPRFPSTAHATAERCASLNVESLDPCSSGAAHDWEDTPESDGKTRRFCRHCYKFGGFVLEDGTVQPPDPLPPWKPSNADALRSH